MDTGKTCADTGETSVVVGETRADTGETSVVMGETCADTGETRVSAGETRVVPRELLRQKLNEWAEMLEDRTGLEAREVGA